MQVSVRQKTSDSESLMKSDMAAEWSEWEQNGYLQCRQ